MDDRKYLTTEEVAERYRAVVSVGTLRNWRAMRVGPALIKIGQSSTQRPSSALGRKETWYPAVQLEKWLRSSRIRRDDHNFSHAISSLLDVLEAAPPADIVDQDAIKVCPPQLNVNDQLFQCILPNHSKPASAAICVGPHDAYIAPSGIGRNGGRLIFNRVFL
jgi:hypothetical protein